MADKIRFHLDEHIALAIAKGLRQRGLDVTTTVSAGLRTQDDDNQMAYVRQTHRVLVTCDAGFLARSSAGEAHAGIAYYPPSTRSIGEVVTFLVLLAEVMAPEEMHGRVEYL